MKKEDREGFERSAFQMYADGVSQQEIARRLVYL